MINVSYIRNNYKCEDAFGDELIRRNITVVHGVFRRYYGDVVDDEHSDLYGTFMEAEAEIVYSRLLKEHLVLTGYGVVVKKNEYSDPAANDAVYDAAAAHVDTATMLLYTLPYDPRAARECIEDSQFVVEGFFRKKKC